MTLAFMFLVCSFDTILSNDLSTKLPLQAEGFSGLVNTYSDILIVAAILYDYGKELTKRIEWSLSNITSTPLRMSLIGEICFGMLAVYFHASGIDEMGKEPHAFYGCYFTAVGAFSNFWHAQGLIEIRTNAMGTIDAKSFFDQNRTKAYYLCLATLPTIFCLFGASRVINRFVFNGFANLFSCIVLDPLFKEAVDLTSKATSTKVLSNKLKLSRLLFPLTALSFLCEGVMADKYEFDTHVSAHIFIGIYVILMHSCLTFSK